MDQILQTVYSPDRKKRLNIFRRENGTFGFEEEYFSKDEYEMCWIPRSSLSVFDSAETALHEARGRVSWLSTPEETHQGL